MVSGLFITLSNIFRKMKSSKNAGRPTKQQQQLREMFKKETRQKQEEARKVLREQEALKRRQSQQQEAINRNRSLSNQRQKAYDTLHRIAQTQAHYDENDEIGEGNDEKVDDKEEVKFMGEDYIQKAYIPPSNSILDRFLKQTKDNVMSKRIPENRIWLAPDTDPLTSACVGEPRPWYINNVWRFIWRPFQQYKHLVDQKCTKCFWCKRAGGLESIKDDSKADRKHQRQLEGQERA